MEGKSLSHEERTIAILVRYNWQIGNIVKEADKIGLSIKITEGGDLYRLPSTLDLYRLVLAVTHSCNKVYLANLIQSGYVSMDIDFAGISGYTELNKTAELVRLLDEYFMLYLGKSWAHVVADFETRPVLVVLRDIYEATKPWTHCYGDYGKREYRENFECLLEKITRRYSNEYLTIHQIQDFLKINITTYQEEASRNRENESDGIQVICTTIHKSKGLEYGTVILPYTSEDISNIDLGALNVNIIDGKVSYSLPTKQNGLDYSSGFNAKTESYEKMCEESRILYVALTRAIRNVVWLKDVDTAIDSSWGRYLEVSGAWQS